MPSPSSDYAVAGAPAWFAPLFRSIDERDWRTFGSFLTPDVVFRYGSAPAVSGHAAVLGAADGAVAPFASVRHELSAFWDSGSRMAMEGQVTYALADGRSVTLPFVNVFGMRDGLIAEYLIYIDPAPVMALFGGGA
jgi:ketosteroid isomerase-like protein